MTASPDALRRGLRTPVTAPPPPPLFVPPTPAKQRRTVHAKRRGEIRSRKRPPTEISQFSALQLDDKSVSAVIPPQLQQQQQQQLQSQSPSQLQLFPSQPFASFIPASPDVLEYSQNDTEYSNFFARRILTDYREVRELGRGSFGRVTLYETGAGALVAVKVSPPLRTAEERQRFASERAIMLAARGFPHVVQLLDAWEEGRVPQVYLQIEYCRGGSLADAAEARRKRGEIWDEREVRVFFAHMAIALDALHSARIAHVDFKPDNVLMDDAGGYRLSDFGCSVFLTDDGRPRAAFSSASVFSSSAACEHSLFGASAAPLSIASIEEGDCRYLCADMLNQKRHLTAGDMFSFGISLFELMSGEPLPPHGPPFLELRRRPPADCLLRRGYSARLVAFVLALMREEPRARPNAKDALRFVMLQPQAPRQIAQWTAREKENGEEEEEEEREKEKDKEKEEGKGKGETGELVEVREMLASLEATARLLDATRKEMQKTAQTAGGALGATGSLCASLNTSAVGALRRARVGGGEELCTPKTPAYRSWPES